MKRCPKCNREYDNTLSFCLDDGAELLYGPALNDDPSTAVLPGATPFADAATRVLRPANDHAALSPSGVDSIAGEGFDKRLLLAPLVLAVIVFGGFVGYRYFSLTREIESIAVMPFANESGNADVEYLSDGMTETLISSLSRLPNLNVKARSSVFRYKGKDTDPRTVAKELNVQAILSGRVTERGDQLTVSLELVDAETEYAIWSQQYTRKKTELVTLQSEIARDVSGKLKTKFPSSDNLRLTKSYTENSEAYQLYLLGRFHWNKRTKIDIHKSIDYFRQAVESDPNYALAYSGLADAYFILQGYDKTVSPIESHAKAREYGMKALSLDDSLSEAHVSIALILQSVDFDLGVRNGNSDGRSNWIRKTPRPVLTTPCFLPDSGDSTKAKHSFAGRLSLSRLPKI